MYPAAGKPFHFLRLDVGPLHKRRNFKYPASRLLKVSSLALSGTAGPATGFTLGQTCTWTLAASTSAITTFSLDKFTLDTSAFLNDATNQGTFSLGLSPDSKSLVLSYTAVPEPATWALLAGGGILGLVGSRRLAARCRLP